MGMHDQDDGTITQWIKRCLGNTSVTVATAQPLKKSTARQVWSCTVAHHAGTHAVILTIYTPDAADSVNTNFSPADTAQKCLLLMQELSPLGIPTATPLGIAFHVDAAAIITERYERTTWTGQTRIDAAGFLAHLHTIPATALSNDLQRLLARSDPKQNRTTYWLLNDVPRLDEQHATWRAQYPELAEEIAHLMQSMPTVKRTYALVHGDYFSANIIPVSDGIRVIDWESCGWGDPMWDLAFLLGADRDIAAEEISAAIRAYSSIAPVELERLLWHKRCWDASWKLRDMMKYAYTK